MKRLGIVVVSLIAASLTACAPESAGRAPSPGQDDRPPAQESPGTSEDPQGTPSSHAPTVSGEPTVIASGLEAPWSIVFHDGTPILSERDSGRILELDDAGGAREIGVVEDVWGAEGEGGLLGLAVRDDLLYAYYTTPDGNRISRFPLQGDPGALALGEPETVLEGIPSAHIHDGGRIAFGPDGMLYATTGDADLGANAQDLDSLGGKILRMTPDGGVPEDNPFSGSLVYSYGHRNPQGIAWDGEGTMYATEFGQNTWDELNVIEPGANYGWPEVEGMAGGYGYVDPVQQWPPAEASPSGMAIAGDRIYIANLRGARLREVPLSALDTAVDHFVGDFGRLRDVTVSPDGSLWVLTSNTDGRGTAHEDDDRILRVGG